MLPFAIPAGASVGDTFARFRVSTAGGLAPTGMANDGEVEDQRVPIVPFGQPAEVTMAANRATVQIAPDGDQLVIRRCGVTLFSIPAEGAGPLTLAGSPLADVFDVSPDIKTPVTLDGGAEINQVRMEVNSNLKLTDALLSVVGGSSISLLSIDSASLFGADAGHDRVLWTRHTAHCRKSQRGRRHSSPSLTLRVTARQPTSSIRPLRLSIMRTVRDFGGSVLFSM